MKYTLKDRFGSSLQGETGRMPAGGIWQKQNCPRMT